jgi:hypothetical protein
VNCGTINNGRLMQMLGWDLEKADGFLFLYHPPYRGA